MRGMLGVTCRPVVMMIRLARIVTSSPSSDPLVRRRSVARCLYPSGSDVLRSREMILVERWMCECSLKWEAYELRYSTKLGREG